MRIEPVVWYARSGGRQFLWAHASQTRADFTPIYYQKDLKYGRNMLRGEIQLRILLLAGLLEIPSFSIRNLHLPNTKKRNFLLLHLYRVLQRSYARGWGEVI